jgi:hypothetical protein
MLSLLAALAVVQSSNLLANPTFAQGLIEPEAWAMNRSAGNRITWVCDRTKSERYAVQLHGAGEDWAGATSRSVSVKPGDILTVAAWIKAADGQENRDFVYVRFYSNGVFRVQMGPAVPSTALQWTLCVGSVVAPAGSDTADFSLQVRSRATILLGAAGLFHGDVVNDVRSLLPIPDAIDPVPVSVPRGKPADANTNGLPDVLEAYLQVPGDAKSSRLTRRATTCLQTGTGYRSDNDLKVDTILLVNSSHEAIESWKAMGYRTPFMAGFRAGQDYVDTHPGSAQMNRAGRALDCGPGSYYMVPTADRRALMRELFRTACANGADGAAPEEPEYIGTGGYSPAFKKEFEAYYHRPWVDPESSPQARVNCQRLMGHLEVELLRACYEGARMGRPDTKAWLLCHSPVNYAAWDIMFPHSEAIASLLVDQMVAQVWTGTAQSAVNHQGVRKSRTFENAYLEYSSSLNLVRGKGISTWLLMNPLEDAPGRPMPECIPNYKRTLGAALMFPQTDLYEVMTWPTHIFGQVPPEFATTICTVVNALGDMQNQRAVTPDHGTEGIASFIADSAMWQRQPPSPSDFDAFYGLTLPLLMKGIPVEVAHLDRAGELNYLKPYRVLLLSFDAMKPAEKADVDGIVAWVKAGGRLLVYGGEDPYNNLDLWWKKEGCASPQEYLLRALGIRHSGIKVIARTALQAAFTEAARTDYTGRKLENLSVVRLELTGAVEETGCAYLKFEDTIKEDGWGAWIGSIVLNGTRGGKPLHLTVKPGTAEEAALIVADTGTGLSGDARFVDARNVLVYRVSFDRGTRADVQVDIGNQYCVSVAPAPTRSAMTLQRVAGSSLGQMLDPAAAEGATGLLAYPDVDAAPALTSFDSPVVAERTVGKGRVLVCGLPAAHFAKSPAADAMLRSMVRYECEQPGGLAYKEQEHLGIRRGAYRIVKTFEQAVPIDEPAIDLMSPELAIRPAGPLGPDDLAILKRLPETPKAAPVVAACSDCIEWSGASGNELRVIVSNASGIHGVMRVMTGGRAISVEAQDSSGQTRLVRVEPQGPSALLRFDSQPMGLAIKVRAE